MLDALLIAAAIVSAPPVSATPQDDAPSAERELWDPGVRIPRPNLESVQPVLLLRQTRIPRMGGFLEWVADGKHGVYIRGDTGQWYYARTQARCPRLRPGASVRFVAPGGNFDRFSTLVVEGWRCPNASVVESPPAPGHEDH